MPLKEGKSTEAFEKNVDELLKAYKKSGRMGNVKPKDKDHARRVALAIAFDKKREGK